MTLNNLSKLHLQIFSFNRGLKLVSRITLLPLVEVVPASAWLMTAGNFGSTTDPSAVSAGNANV